MSFRDGDNPVGPSSHPAALHGPGTGQPVDGVVQPS